MTGTNVLSYELIAIIITLLGGFSTIVYLLGKRNRDIDHLQEEVEECKQNLQDHDEACKKTNKEIMDKLSEGSNRFTRIETMIDSMKETLAEIKDMVRPKP